MDLDSLKEENSRLKKELEELKTTPKRIYMPTFSEIIDRLSIINLKYVFITEHRDKYAAEIKEILQDLDTILSEETDGLKLNSELIQAILVVAQYNLHIWHSESAFRRGEPNSNKFLEKTHSLNGIRARAKNIIQNNIGGRQDWKIDCLAAEFSNWEPVFKKD